MPLSGLRRVGGQGSSPHPSVARQICASRQLGLSVGVMVVEGRATLGGGDVTAPSCELRMPGVTSRPASVPANPSRRQRHGCWDTT